MTRRVMEIQKHSSDYSGDTAFVVSPILKTTPPPNSGEWLLIS